MNQTPGSADVSSASGCRRQPGIHVRGRWRTRRPLPGGDCSLGPWLTAQFSFLAATITRFVCSMSNVS